MKNTNNGQKVEDKNCRMRRSDGKSEEKEKEIEM
jgi:hypothetical protein